MEGEKTEVRNNPQLALGALTITPLEEEKHAKYQQNNAVDGVPIVIITLQEILEAELLLIPATQDQDQLLRYRYRMLQCLDGLEDQEHIKKFDLMPLAGYTRIFVRLDRNALAHLAPKVMRADGQLVIQPFLDRDFSDILPLVFKPEKLAKLAQSNKGWQWGDSFSTDEIQAQLRMVDEQNRVNKRRKFDAIAAAREGEERVPAALRVEPTAEDRTQARLAKDEEQRLKLLRNSTIPKNAILVGCDPGLRNMATFCWAAKTGSGHYVPSERFRVISTASVYHDTGQDARRDEFNKVLRRETGRNDTFAAASTAVADARTKTADPDLLLAALHMRGKHFRTLYKFYGQPTLARRRWANYQSMKAWMDRLVYDIFPTRNHILVIGDATFANSVKGLPPGLITKVLKYFEMKGKGGQMRWVDEYRTSKLDSYNHSVVSYPPQGWGYRVNRNGVVVKFLKRINGLAQSSVTGAPRLSNRDKNGARNILKKFISLCETGHFPKEFERTTPTAELVRPKAFYAYYSQRRNGRRGFYRVIRRPEAAPPLPVPQPGALDQQQHQMQVE